MASLMVNNQLLSAQEIFNNYTARDLNVADCNDASSIYHPLTKRYKDVDGDGYSDGTMTQQCGQPAGYQLAANLTAIAGDCDDNNDLLNTATTWYLDADADGFSEGTTSNVCADPGATWYLKGQLQSDIEASYPIYTGLRSGLVGYRPFDEGTGSTAYNAMGTGGGRRSLSVKWRPVVNPTGPWT